MIKALKITQGDVALVLEGHFVTHRDGAVPAISGQAKAFAGQTTDIQRITNAAIEADTGEVLLQAWQAGVVRDTDQGLEVRFEGTHITPRP